MKNIRRLLAPLLFAALFFTACKDKCDSADFGISSLQPAANPAGYEVFIGATGVTANTKVRFDAVDAASVKTAEGGLIVKVPTGISGTVSLSIEEGNCNDSRSFDVLGSYPGNAPASPTVIVIPQAPGSLPTGISNSWVNVFDADHQVSLQDNDFPADGIFDDGFFESHFGGLSYFNNNPVSGNYNIQANNIFVVIDRSAKSGGFKDTLTGQFIPNLSATPQAKFTILLTSKRTGRQLVLFRDF